MFISWLFCSFWVMQRVLGMQRGKGVNSTNQPRAIPNRNPRWVLAFCQRSDRSGVPIVTSLTQSQGCVRERPRWGFLSRVEYISVILSSQVKCQPSLFYSLASTLAIPLREDQLEAFFSSPLTLSSKASTSYSSRLPLIPSSLPLISPVHHYQPHNGIIYWIGK